MKLSKIECLIEPYQLADIKEALTRFGVSGLTMYEVKGFGAISEHKEVYRGAEYKVDFTPKLKLELLVAADRVDETVEVIYRAAKPEKNGDGKVFVSPLDSILRIRTGEWDMQAI